MADNLLEQLRFHSARIELLENALCQALAFKGKFSKDVVVCDLLIHKILTKIEEHSKFVNGNLTAQPM